MQSVLLVGLGGFLGSIGRYGLSGLVHRLLGQAFPYGTLAVNALGCFAIGSVLYLAEERAVLSAEVRLFVAVGVLGGFTTFSAFGYETLEQLRAHELLLAGLNIREMYLGAGRRLARWSGNQVVEHLTSTPTTRSASRTTSAGRAGTKRAQRAWMTLLCTRRRREAQARASKPARCSTEACARPSRQGGPPAW